MKNLFTAIFLLSTISSFAQEDSKSRRYSSKAPIVNTDEYLLDLTSAVSSVTYTVEGKKPIKLKIVNMLPSGQYILNQSMQLTLSPPIPLPTSDTQAVSPQKATCDQLADKFKTAKTEIEFANVMKEAKAKQCDELVAANTMASTFVYDIKSSVNSTTTVTVTNTGSNKSWTVVFQAEQKGQFVTLYGFSYIPHLFSKSHTYFAQPVPGVINSYTIKKAARESIADYAPTVAFHFITKSSNSISNSFLAGLGVGFNSDNASITPVVITGYSMLIHQNIGVNIGMAGHLVTNLKGKYAENQVISTNLESSDLTEKTIGFNPYISIAFRFGSSPFSVKGVNTAAANTTTTPSR